MKAGTALASRVPVGGRLNSEPQRPTLLGGNECQSLAPPGPVSGRAPVTPGDPQTDAH